MTDPLDYRSTNPYEAAADATDMAHLRALAICHYVWGGMLFFFGSFPILHLVMGVFLLKNPAFMQSGANGPPPEFAWLMIGFASCIIVFAWILAVMTIYSGRCISRQTNRTLTFIVAGFNCLSIPLGTTLGVFTFIVLVRPSVKSLYDRVLHGSR